MDKKDQEKVKMVKAAVSKEEKETSVFKHTLLADVKQIEFPFTDDPEEYYIIELKDREIEVNQVNGTLLSEKRSPFTVQLSALSLDLHTGRINAVWAVILAIACLNILFFIYSGFAITLKRRSSRIKNKFKASESTFILLVGSENGSTFRFANSIQKQLINHGQKVFVSELNKFSVWINSNQ